MHLRVHTQPIPESIKPILEAGSVGFHEVSLGPWLEEDWAVATVWSSYKWLPVVEVVFV